MDEKKYKELNDYFNRVFLTLSINDEFFIKNLYDFGINSSQLIQNVDSEIKNNVTNDNLSFLQIYDIGKVIINDINPDYEKEYEEILDSGILQVSYDRVNKPKDNKVYYPRAYCNEYNNIIYIEDAFNYNTVPTLIHEFMHYNNRSNLVNRYLLTEFISIYFELYSYEYLLENGLSKDKVDLSRRINSLVESADFLQERCLFLMAYNNFGNFNDKTYDYIYKYIGYISKEEYEEVLIEMLEEFKLTEEKYYHSNIDINQNDLDYMLSNKYITIYKYFMCTLLSFYSLKYLDKDNVIQLNELLRNKKAKSVSALLNEIGITFDDEFISKAIESVNDYINYYDLHETKKLVLT